MPKKRVTQIANEKDVSFEEIMHLVKTKLAQESVTGKGKAIWVDEEGQGIIDEAFEIPEITPKYYKGKVLYEALNKHYVYAHIPEIQKKVPVVIGRLFIGKLIGKQIDIEAISDNQGVSYRHSPRKI